MQASESLKSVGIFAGLPAETLKRLQMRCNWRCYEQGEPIIDYLDSSDDVFFIITGETRASIYSYAGKVVSFSDLGPGDTFGEYAAIDGVPRSASIEARSSCKIASMSGVAFRELIESEPAIALALLRQAVAKVRTLTTRVYEFSALAVSNRIQAEVLRLANSAPRNGGTAHLTTAPTHSDIASRISTHREAVTRELNRLAKIGILERRGSGLIVKDIDRLATMVQEVTGE